MALLNGTFYTVATLVGLYTAFLGLLTSPAFQKHVVYLHKVQMTWFKDLNVPESFGFLHGQVTPFSIRSSHNTLLYAWHILPLGTYLRHEDDLIADDSGFAADFDSRLAFKLLRDDPEARLIIHLHGAAGTVGSGYRVPNYRALSSAQPNKIHVLTFDYRGFGRSPGVPSETGVCTDAIAVVNWALQVAGIPPSRILLFGQSLGTAVSLAVSEYFALQSPPIVFAGTILVAPFVDVATLVATYRIAGTIPIISPLARFPALFSRLNTFIDDKWSSKDRIAEYIKANEANGHKYRITMMHAEDDYDIPFSHTERLYWHAVNATTSQAISYNDFQEDQLNKRKDLGAGGYVTDLRTQHGLIRKEILKTGLHDVIMGNPVITKALIRMLEDAES